MSTEIIFLGLIVLIAAIDYFFKKNKNKGLLNVNNKPKNQSTKVVFISIVSSFLAASLNSIILFFINPENVWFSWCTGAEDLTILKSIVLGYECNLESTLYFHCAGLLGGPLLVYKEGLIDYLYFHCAGLLGGPLLVYKEGLIDYLLKRKKNTSLFIISNFLLKVLIHYIFYPSSKNLGYYFEVIFQERIIIFIFSLLITSFLAWYFNDKIKAR